MRAPTSYVYSYGSYSQSEEIQTRLLRTPSGVTRGSGSCGAQRNPSQNAAAVTTTRSRSIMDFGQENKMQFPFPHLDCKISGVRPSRFQALPRQAPHARHDAPRAWVGTWPCCSKTLPNRAIRRALMDLWHTHALKNLAGSPVARSAYPLASTTSLRSLV